MPDKRDYNWQMLNFDSETRVFFLSVFSSITDLALLVDKKILEFCADCLKLTKNCPKIKKTMYQSDDYYKNSPKQFQNMVKFLLVKQEDIWQNIPF